MFFWSTLRNHGASYLKQGSRTAPHHRKHYLIVSLNEKTIKEFANLILNHHSSLTDEERKSCNTHGMHSSTWFLAIIKHKKQTLTKQS